jgi:hypothetical protein
MLKSLNYHKQAQTQHFCYEPPMSRNQLIGKGFQRCHVF